MDYVEYPFDLTLLNCDKVSYIETGGLVRDQVLETRVLEVLWRHGFKAS